MPILIIRVHNVPLQRMPMSGGEIYLNLAECTWDSTKSTCRRYTPITSQSKSYIGGDYYVEFGLMVSILVNFIGLAYGTSHVISDYPNFGVIYYFI